MEGERKGERNHFLSMFRRRQGHRKRKKDMERNVEREEGEDYTFWSSLILGREHCETTRERGMERDEREHDEQGVLKSGIGGGNRKLNQTTSCST